MTTSFPFLAIARRFDVPYRKVLRMRELYQNYANEHPYEPVLPPSGGVDDGSIQRAIYDAFVAERWRRTEVVRDMRDMANAATAP